MVKNINKFTDLKNIGDKGKKIIKGKNGKRLIIVERISKKGFPQFKIISNKKM